MSLITDSFYVSLLSLHSDYWFGAWELDLFQLKLNWIHTLGTGVLSLMEPCEVEVNHLKMLTIVSSVLFCSSASTSPQYFSMKTKSQWDFEACSTKNEYRAQIVTWLFSPPFGAVKYIMKSEQLLWSEETFFSSSFTFSTNCFLIHNPSKLTFMLPKNHH